MSGVSVKVDDSGAKLVSAEAELGNVYLMHSGALPETISVEPDGENRTLVCVAARSGTVLVSIAYDDDSVYEDQSWEVFPGAPLKVLAGEVPETVTIEQVGSELPQVEVLVAESDVEVLELEFLVLNAGVGVRTGVPEDDVIVLGWHDVRPISGAPEEFTYSSVGGHGPRLIESDPDFNGHASVFWGEREAGGLSNGFLVYSEPEEGLFDFLGAGGEYLLLAIVKPPEDRGLTSEYFLTRAGSGPGFVVGVDGGYRLTFAAYGDTPVSAVVEVTDEKELIRDGTPMVLAIKYSADGVFVYKQGYWKKLANFPSGLTTAASSEVLRIGTAALRDLKIADLRIWNSMPETVDEKIAEYLEFAADYGVDDTVRQDHPWVTGAYSMFRANRGVGVTAAALTYNWLTDAWMDLPPVVSWEDTRPEATMSEFDIQVLPSGFSLGDIISRQAIEAYGEDESTAGPSFRSLNGDSGSHPIGTEEWAVACVFQCKDENPPGDPDGLRGGVVLSVGGHSPYAGGSGWPTVGANAGEACVLITADGEVRFTMTDASAPEEVVDVELLIPTMFVNPMALLVRVDETRVLIDVCDLETGETYQLVEPIPTPWVPVTPPTSASTQHVYLFDSGLAYYNWQAPLEGFIGEVTILDEYPSNAVRDRFFAYAQRHYRTDP